ncbi:OTU family ubiquitin thioesterase, partial [Erwinia mallotivora]|uniref:OTU family ubiquitin thioesterase n=2 Tax=Erwinia mallotivora TaxID=69222 RepID=UPI0021C09361
MDVSYTSRNNSASTINQALEEKVQACPTRSSALLNLIESAEQNPRVVNEFYRMQSSDCTSNLLNTVALSRLPEDLMKANLSTEGQAARNLLGILVHHVDAADKKIFLKACDYLLRTSNPKIKSTERHSLENKTAGLLKTLLSKHGKDAFNIFYLNFVQHCREAWAKHHNVSLEGVRDEDIFTASYNSCADVFTGQIEQLNLPDANWTSLTQFNDFIMDTISAIPKTLKFKEDSDDKKPEEAPPAKSPVNNLAGPANPAPATPAGATPDTARDRAINIHVEGSKAEARIGDGSAAAPAATGSTVWDFGNALINAPINEKSKVDLLKQLIESQLFSRPSGVLANIKNVTPFNGRVDGNSSEPDGVPEDYSSEPDGATSVDPHRDSPFTERNIEGEPLIPTKTVAPSLQRAVSDVNFASQEGIRWLQAAESEGALAAGMQGESVITQQNVSGNLLTASETVAPSWQRAVSDVNFASQEGIRWLQAAESDGSSAAGVQSESVVTEQNTNANFYTVAKDLSRSLSETLTVALDGQRQNLQPEVRPVTEDSVGNLVSEPLLSQSTLSEDVQHPPKQTAEMIASYDEVDSVAPAAYELIKQQQRTADFSAFNQPVSKNASSGFISGNDASARRIAPQTLAKTEDLANWIATRGNWSGNAGDIAPNLITNLFQNITLRINVFDIHGRLINPVTTGFDHTETKRLVELNLRNDHYSPVIYGLEKEAPADGDCFYYSTLYVLNGVKPSGDDIQQLRNRLADYIRQNREDIMPYISDELHHEINQQGPFALTDGSSTTEVDSIDVHRQGSENVTPVVKNIPEPPKPVIEHDIHTKSAPPVDTKPTPRLNGEGQAEEHQSLTTGATDSSVKGKSNLLNEIQQEIARRNAAKRQPSAENEATPRLNGDGQAEERQPLAKGGPVSAPEGKNNLLNELQQEIARRNAAKRQPSAENEATPRLNGEGQAEEHQPLAKGATDSSVKGESNLAAEIRQAVERRNAAKRQPSAENEATPRLNGDGQAEERQPL